MAILKFMKDEHLYNCIFKLYKAYIKNKRELKLKDLYKNKLDPIKAYFDIEFNELKLEEFINIEINRKVDKNINNHIGIFHQELLNGIDGFEAPERSGYDVKNLDNTIFGELKNKHNTMNSSSAESTFNKLKKYADCYPQATCYLIEVVANKSQNILWTPSFSGESHSHPRIRRISIDKFYELATGKQNSFKELCYAIFELTPKVIKDIKEKKHSLIDNCVNTNSAYDELVLKSKKSCISALDVIFKDNFNGYNGF